MVQWFTVESSHFLSKTQLLTTMNHGKWTWKYSQRDLYFQSGGDKFWNITTKRIYTVTAPFPAASPQPPNPGPYLPWDVEWLKVIVQIQTSLVSWTKSHGVNAEIDLAMVPHKSSWDVAVYKASLKRYLTNGYIIYNYTLTQIQEAKSTWLRSSFKDLHATTGFMFSFPGWFNYV